MAMTLATADAQGRPSSRTVLLKEMNERGFVFYTSLTSRKARHLAANPRAALCFFWQPLMEQVLIEGTVEPVSDQEADAYWASQPRARQFSAWASRPSKPSGPPGWPDTGRIPRPSFWSGFHVVPDRMEFWKRGPFRFHERVLYDQCKGQWRKQRKVKNE
jgi:pyridoxamine 5'-phosphate oxidase